MKIFIQSLLLVTIFTNLYGQVRWNYSPNNSGGNLFKDERSNNLGIVRQIIVNDSVGSDPWKYSNAVEYLYFYHKVTESQFLLDNLNTRIDTTIIGNKLHYQWKKIYTDKYFLGLLGDQTAIEGMDSVAQYSTNSSVKTQAIRRLAEIGRFDYYDYVKESYLNNPDVIRPYPNLSLYGSDNRYTNEIREVFLDKIRTIDKNDHSEVYKFALYLMDFDRISVIDIYKDYFYSTEGNIRYMYFRDLENLDRDGQPKRAMDVLPIETDQDFQWEYIPNPWFIHRGPGSKGYLTPIFIKYLTEINLDYNPDARSRKVSYLNALIPLKPDSIITTFVMLDTLNSYTNQSYNYEWLKDETYKTELLSKITNAKNYLNSGDSTNCAIEIKTFQNSIDEVYSDSSGSYPKYINNEGYRFLYYYSRYILDRLPAPLTPKLNIKLIDSQNNLLLGGSLKYYEGGWKDAEDHGDGTFTVDTEKETIKLRMTYAFASRDMDNVVVGGDTAVFQTVPTEVQLQNSQNQLIDEGTVKYYAGGWRTFGTTSGGITAKELLPNSYKFRMTYDFASEDQTQDIAANAVVGFKTMKARVELRDSQNQLMDEGVVKYYSGGWRDFGVTSGGIVEKELLAQSYKFRMQYGFASTDKQQDLSENGTVEFNTVLTTVQVKDAQAQPVDGATVKYYSGGWRDFGATTSGVSNKELLPMMYKFRAIHGGVQKDVDQDVSVSAVVEIEI
jgi:hypothetical protein